MKYKLWKTQRKIALAEVAASQQETKESSFLDLGILRLEDDCDIEEVVVQVTAYVKRLWMKWMLKRPLAATIAGSICKSTNGFQARDWLTR